MKKSVLFICIALLSLTSRATIHVVKVADFNFSPSDIPNVIVGDTMRWEWVSGRHTTTGDATIDTNISIPAGAAAWNNPMNSTNTVFEYKVTVAGTYNYLCLPHRSFMTASFIASSVLPIKLSSFAVGAATGKAVINWKTLTEQNADYFSVRRSLNGVNYTEIARIPAAGNSDKEKAYSYTDVNVSNGRYYYYNLAVVDKDGRKEYSETKIYKSKAEISNLILSISPNPINRPGHLMMTFNAAKEGKMEVSVLNQQGQAVLKTQMQAYQGVNSGHVHLGELSPGNYTIVCTLAGVREAHKIIVK